MKDFLFAVVFALFVLASLLYQANAMETERKDNSCGDGLTWSIDETNTTLTITGHGDMTNFSSEKPDAAPWYPYRNTTTTVVITEGVTSVGSYAFYDCVNLTNAILPSSLTLIEERSFQNCKKLANFSIPSNVRAIGEYAFFNCKELTSIKIPNGVTTINASLFRFCTNLKSVSIPESVVEIGRDAFFECKSLTDLIIPDSVKSIEGTAFYGCDSLTNLTLPANLEYIGPGAFYECDGLTRIVIPDNVVSIEEKAFYECSNLVDVTIPDSVTCIGENVFSYCKNLELVFYQGSYDFSLTFGVFADSSDIIVCVPPDYIFSTFCGKPVTINNSQCKGFQSYFDKCNKAVFNGTIIQVPKKSTREWVEKSDECIDYKCDSITGPYKESVCNTHDGIRYYCMKDKCITAGGLSVEIEVDETKATELNVTAILEDIAKEAGMNSNDVRIAYESDENGNVIRIVIFVDDKKTADEVADAITNLANKCDDKQKHNN